MAIAWPAARAEADVVADPDGARVALTTLAEDLGGRVDVLHFNPSAFRQEDPLHLSVPHLLEDVALGVGALLTAVQAVRPFLRSGSRVTATGSMAADKETSLIGQLSKNAEGRFILTEEASGDSILLDSPETVNLADHEGNKVKVTGKWAEDHKSFLVSKIEAASEPAKY